MIACILSYLNVCFSFFFFLCSDLLIRVSCFFTPILVYHAIYLEELTAVELTEKLAQLFSISPRQISQIFKQGPTGIHVLVSDEVIRASTGFLFLLLYLFSFPCTNLRSRNIPFTLEAWHRSLFC